jgi:hypothetical protein
MKRPERQLKDLREKLAKKAERRGASRKPGAKEKRWKKSAEQYKALVE